MFTRGLPLLLAFFCQFVFLSLPAQAATSKPVIDSFTVEQVDTLNPGTELLFSVSGTAAATATVRITGISRSIKLEEVDPGEYEGFYTIKSKDKISANTKVRATLKKGTRTSSKVSLDTPLTLSGSGSSSSDDTRRGSLSIERFTLAPVDAIAPGTDLNFKLTGTPHAKASMTIDGVTTNLPMTETRSGSGVYDARYTIRRQDNFPSGVKIMATLTEGSQSVSMRMDQTLVKDSSAPVIRNLKPQDGEIVSSSDRIFISGSFEDGPGSGVDPRSVVVRFAGRDVTPQAVITSDFFSYESERNLANGDYRVEVSAKDLNGQSVRTSWRFRVEESATTSRFPLEITSPANNAQISNDGPTEIRGRSAPNIDIMVTVDSTASLAGLFGVNQNIMTDTLRTDSRGAFRFSFQPRFAVSGTRYQIKLTATNGGQTREATLVLFPRK